MRAECMVFSSRCGASPGAATQSYKAATKTIDTCNNPMTKEPKLQGARRIVAEWTELDDEARTFTAAVEAGEGAVAAPRGEAAAAGDSPHTEL